MSSESPHDAGAQPAFSAVLTPHRSLSPVGFWIVMGVVAGVGFIAGIAFFLIGAWPVVGFFGLDVALIYWAFRASYRSGRVYETLDLDDDTLTVRRFDPRGAETRWTFQSYWLRVDMDDPPRHDSALVLRSHGRFLKIGAFLTPGERLEVAEALRAALERQRNDSAAIPAN